VVQAEVAWQQPPSREAGTNCPVDELAMVVVAALVVTEVLASDLSGEILHAGTVSCLQLHGFQALRDPLSLIPTECRQ